MEAGLLKLASKRKEQRSKAACNHCNERKIKCDVLTRGVPCSNCEQSCLETCMIHKSRRVRGDSGRFISLSQKKDLESCTASISPHTESREDRVTMASRSSDGDGSDQGPHIHFTETSAESAALWHSQGILQNEGTSHEEESSYLSQLLQKISPHRLTSHQSEFTTHSVDLQAGFVGISTANMDPTLLGLHVVDGSNLEEAPSISMPIDLPPVEVQNSLVKSYFMHFHSTCPILPREQFLTSLNDGMQPQTLLLRCVLYVGAVHCDPKILYRMGFTTVSQALDVLYEKAKNEFDAGRETDELKMLQSSVLLHYQFSSHETFGAPRWWLSRAISAAQTLHMNRRLQMGDGKWESRRLWRRTWWLLYIFDCQLSLTTGRPMIVRADNCDVEDLEKEDFSDEPPDTALYVIFQTRLCRAASQTMSTFSSWSKKFVINTVFDGKMASDMIEMIFSAWLADIPDEMKREATTNPLSLILHTTYDYYRLILHQMLFQLATQRLPDFESEETEVILNIAEEMTSTIHYLHRYLAPSSFPRISVAAIFFSLTIQLHEFMSSETLRRETFQQSLDANLRVWKGFEACYNLTDWTRSLFTHTQRDPPAISNLPASYIPSLAHAVGLEDPQTPTNMSVGAARSYSTAPLQESVFQSTDMGFSLSTHPFPDLYPPTTDISVISNPAFYSVQDPRTRRR